MLGFNNISFKFLPPDLGHNKRIPWFPFTCEQFMKPHDKQILIEKEGPPSHRVMQTKICALTSSIALSHSCRDSNGNVTLLIDSVTKDTLIFDYVCKYDHELNDCICNSVLSRLWCKIAESKNEYKENAIAAMDNLTRTNAIPVALSANALEWFF